MQRLIYPCIAYAHRRRNGDEKLHAVSGLRSSKQTLQVRLRITLIYDLKFFNSIMHASLELQHAHHSSKAFYFMFGRLPNKIYSCVEYCAT